MMNGLTPAHQMEQSFSLRVHTSVLPCRTESYLIPYSFTSPFKKYLYLKISLCLFLEMAFHTVQTSPEFTMQLRLTLNS